MTKRLNIPSFHGPWLITFFCLFHSATGQVTALTIDTVAIHDGVDLPALEGHTTFRLYAEVSSATDFLSAVYGDFHAPFMITADSGFFQSGGALHNLAQNVSPLLYDFVPELQYDSWFTIGVEDGSQGSPLQLTSSSLSDDFENFNEGDGFIVDDVVGGAWFNIFQCASTPEECAEDDAAFGGEDMRILLGQFTTKGHFRGIFNLQLFPDGDQNNELYQTFAFSTNPLDVFGCTNPEAIEGTYSPEANIDDFSCVLPCFLSLSVSAITPPTCHGDADASFSLEAVGASGADYYYLDSIGSQQGQNSGHFGNLFAGTYMAFVEDSEGCRDTVEVVVPVTELIEVDIELTAPVSCAGESDAELSVVSATGGTGAFTYFLSSDPENTTTETTWTGLAPGQTLSVWATDINGCIQQSNNSLAITSPTEVSVSLSTAGTGILNASCPNSEDGGIFLVGLGGNDPASIQFSVDGTVFGPSPLSVSPGEYSIYAQDAFGCVDTLEQTIVVGFDGGDGCSGCTDISACNYESSASEDDGSCLYLDATGDCGGVCMFDLNSNGVCDNNEIPGCTYPGASNFSIDATDDDGTCMFEECGETPNEGDFDGDHVVGLSDFLTMLSLYGEVDIDQDGAWDSVDLCEDISACNFSASPSEPCAYPNSNGDCD